MSKPIATVDRTRELLESLQVRPLKRLGQNFLVQPQIALDIVNLYPLTSNDTVVEVGPGLGALTEILCQRAKNVYAIEFDHGLAKALSQTIGSTNLTVIDGDALKVSLPDELIRTSSVVLFSNVPYYITTDVVLHALLEWPLQLASVILLVQKEVATKWSKSISVEEQTASECIIKGLCDVTLGLHVSHHAFYPKPDVHSAVVVLKPIKVITASLRDVVTLINQSYASKRKTIISTLVNDGYNRNQLLDIFTKLGWDEMLRPSQLTFNQWEQLSNQIKESHETE